MSPKLNRKMSPKLIRKMNPILISTCCACPCEPRPSRNRHRELHQEQHVPDSSQIGPTVEDQTTEPPVVAAQHVTRGLRRKLTTEAPIAVPTTKAPSKLKLTRKPKPTNWKPPKPTKAPKATKSPKPTKSPKATKPPKTTKAPKATKAPKSPKSPKSPKTKKNQQESFGLLALDPIVEHIFGMSHQDNKIAIAVPQLATVIGANRRQMAPAKRPHLPQN
ncbi:hypothetical protein GCK72_022640 [Caenorhabditis remanei]|uniref:Uncharacterized protein n=1 Tax=Caenorhabditis remanei TaxID=31234 RepID=A0A6A5FUC4_CAERE|nr:hypothetical protein GCK72_022640 [Caenorhabditis remanei]KAF1746187.1 hypothetical protein GCK72_022640 [Caenorhabditis remanei]